jgi:uncharacterized protein YrrD
MEMKSSSQVIGLPLMGVKEGKECGIIQNIVVDPQTKKIKSLILRGSKNEYDFRELKLANVIGIGKDYVITQTVENAVSIDRADTGITLINTKSIASSGDVLGSIKDFSFDEKTGDIQSVKIEGGLDVAGKNILSLSNNLMFVEYGGGAAPTVFAKETGNTASVQKEQRDYMLGRTVKNDITAAGGRVVVKKGTVVTEDVIRAAEDAGVIIDLTLEL